MAIRLKVKEAAIERGFNQSSLSREANLAFSTVKRMFHNPYHPTDIEVLGKVAKALGIKDVNELMEIEEEPGK